MEKPTASFSAFVTVLLVCSWLYCYGAGESLSGDAGLYQKQPHHVNCLRTLPYWPRYDAYTTVLVELYFTRDKVSRRIKLFHWFTA